MYVNVAIHKFTYSAERKLPIYYENWITNNLLCGLRIATLSLILFKPYSCVD